MTSTDIILIHYWRHTLYRHMLLSYAQTAGLCAVLFSFRQLLLESDTKRLDYTFSQGNLAWHLNVSVSQINFDKRPLGLPEPLKIDDPAFEVLLSHFQTGCAPFSASAKMQEFTHIFFETIPSSWRDSQILHIPGLTLSWRCENLTMSQNIATILSSSSNS
jgi:hypothetical protein